MFVLFSKTAVSLPSITFSNSVAVSVLLGNTLSVVCWEYTCLLMSLLCTYTNTSANNRTEDVIAAILLSGFTCDSMLMDIDRGQGNDKKRRK